jgi:type II restriction enzyme
LAQVKAKKVVDPSRIPEWVLGGGWQVQKARMDSGIYFPLFLVLFASANRYAVYYLSADLQDRHIFVPRPPLSATARRAGWRGFRYKLKGVRPGAIVKLLDEGRH